MVWEGFMDISKKYKTIRRRLEFASFMLALIIGDIISSYLGIYGNKLISLDTALSLAIVLVLSFVLNIIAVRIADNWYAKNKDK